VETGVITPNHPRIVFCDKLITSMRDKYQKILECQHSFIHCSHLYNASSRGTTRKRSQP